MLTLQCPRQSDHYYEAALVGYIIHGDEEQSGAFVINNNMTLRTHSLHLKRGVNIEAHSPPLLLPVNVSIESLAKGAYIEITELACMEKAPDLDSI